MAVGQAKISWQRNKRSHKIPLNETTLKFGICSSKDTLKRIKSVNPFNHFEIFIALSIFTLLERQR